ncbi:MAG: hypothetical protein JWN17_1824 [Frankiales bacterium]|nr:hypothetical protein [Frankiales bacterium]
MPDVALAEALRDLSRLLSRPDEQTVRETLLSVAGLAVRAVPGATRAGLSMLEQDRPRTVVATDDVATGVEDEQYRLGEGPGVLAVGSSRTQASGSLGGDTRWPRFGPRAGRLGVHSVLSVPLLLPGGVAGALDVWSDSKHAFTPEAARYAELFARPAAASVSNVQVLGAAQRLAAQLGLALLSRSTIDQAVGIVMSRTGASAEGAFERLTARSQTEHLKVTVVARGLVDEARRAARARQQSGPGADPPESPVVDPPSRRP